MSMLSRHKALVDLFSADTAHPKYFDNKCPSRGHCAATVECLKLLEPDAWEAYRGKVNKVSHWVAYHKQEHKFLDLTSDQFNIPIFYSEVLPPSYKNFKPCDTKDKDTKERGIKLAFRYIKTIELG